MQLKNKEERASFEKWAKDELPELLSKDPTASERLLDALIPMFDSLLKKAESDKNAPMLDEDLKALADFFDEVEKDLCKKHRFGKTFFDPSATYEDAIEAIKDKDVKALRILTNGLKVYKIIASFSFLFSEVLVRISIENSLKLINQLLLYLEDKV